MLKNIINRVLRIFSVEKGVFFVGSTDKLPEPLSREEEASYVDLATLGDDKAKSKLIEHNLRLVVFLSKKYENTKVDLEDLVSIGSIGLIKGINTYKVDNAVVEEIIFRKESKNLPIETKVTKKDLIEIETYRFLNKYGYDNMENKTEEKKYYDTTANEITRIIEYINTSGILKEEK